MSVKMPPKYHAIGYGFSRVEALRDFYTKAESITGREMVDICIEYTTNSYHMPHHGKTGRFEADFTLLPKTRDLSFLRRQANIAKHREDKLSVDKLVDEIIAPKKTE
ncbi:MAG: hypothetical protein Q7K45_01860 [Nanoarchaeota archaeon]|nr:hypothetical protein [Nanoarchaeota archaeon]